MAYYSDELIDEVRDANDIVDVIGGYVHLQKKGNAYFGLCPFHNEKTPSFSVSRDRQTFHCYGCGEGGTVLTFLMKYENLTFPEAVQSLAERVHIELPKQEPNAAQRREADRRTKLLAINKEAATYFYRLLRSPQGAHALAYFEKRELTAETMQRFGLGYSNKYSDDLYRYLKQKGYTDDLLKDSGLVTLDEKHGGRDKFWNRAMFPIMDVNNRVIGFGGRVMGEGEPKYLNSPETEIFNKSRNLYGLHFARKSRRRGFLLCEGYMDVISLHQAGFDNAVASLGTSLTAGQANLLKRYAKEIYLTYDSDEAGIRAALRAIAILKEAGFTARIVNMEPHKDPDEFIKARGAEAYQQRIEEAENSFLFEVRMSARDYNLEDPDGKTSFFRNVSKRLLDWFPERLERENYIEALSRLYPVGLEQLKDMVNREALRRGGASEQRPLRPVVQGEKKKEDGINRSQNLLLTWILDDPAVFDAVAAYIGPDDFEGEIYRQVAAEVFAGQASGGAKPAQIISRFPEEEQQRAVEAMFHAEIQPMQDKTRREKTLTETVRRIKRRAIENRSKTLDPTDIAGLQKLIEDRTVLSKLRITIKASSTDD